MRRRWRDDLGQYASHVHAGLICALVDTACGFADSTVIGRVTASHQYASFLAGDSWEESDARLIRANARRVFGRTAIARPRAFVTLLLARGIAGVAGDVAGAEHVASASK